MLLIVLNLVFISQPRDGNYVARGPRGFMTTIKIQTLVMITSADDRVKMMIQTMITNNQSPRDNQSTHFIYFRTKIFTAGCNFVCQQKDILGIL